MAITHIPYNPQTDPRQYLAQALQQGLSGYLAQRQKQQFVKGLSPTMAPMQLLQKALMSGYPLRDAVGAARLAPTRQSGFTLGAGQTRFDAQGKEIARGRVKETKIGELLKEGYSLDEARMIRDISHGLKPRASSRKKYDNMSDEEKLAWLSNEKQRAEGQYYATLKAEAEMEGEGRKIEPRQPKYLKWINEELTKLPMFKEEAIKTEAKDKETKAYEKLSEILPKLPLEVIKMINQAMELGMSHSEVLNADELKPYLEK